MLTYLFNGLAEFNRIILRFCTRFDLIDSTGDLDSIHILRIRTIFGMNDRIYKPILKHFSSQPTDHATGSAPGTPTVHRHISGISTQVIT